MGPGAAGGGEAAGTLGSTGAERRMCAWGSENRKEGLLLRVRIRAQLGCNLQKPQTERQRSRNANSFRLQAFPPIQASFVVAVLFCFKLEIGSHSVAQARVRWC